MQHGTAEKSAAFISTGRFGVMPQNKLFPMIKKTTLTISIILGLGTFLFSQTDKKDKQIVNEIDSYLSGQFGNNQPGCAILVAKKGQVLYKRGFGLANMEWNIPIGTNTVFQIGSVTKLLTALGIMQLAEKQSYL